MKCYPAFFCCPLNMGDFNSHEPRRKKTNWTTHHCKGCYLLFLWLVHIKHTLFSETIWLSSKYSSKIYQSWWSPKIMQTVWNPLFVSKFQFVSYNESFDCCNALSLLWTLRKMWTLMWQIWLKKHIDARQKWLSISKRRLAYVKSFVFGTNFTGFPSSWSNKV